MPDLLVIAVAFLSMGLGSMVAYAIMKWSEKVLPPLEETTVVNRLVRQADKKLAPGVLWLGVAMVVVGIVMAFVSWAG